MQNMPNTQHLCPKFCWVAIFVKDGRQIKSETESLGTLAHAQLVVIGCMHYEKWVGLRTGVLYWTVRDGGLLPPIPFFLEALENQFFLACHRHPKCKKCVYAKSTCAQVVTMYRVEYIPPFQAVHGISTGDKDTASVLD